MLPTSPVLLGVTLCVLATRSLLSPAFLILALLPVQLVSAVPGRGLGGACPNCCWCCQRATYDGRRHGG